MNVANLLSDPKPHHQTRRAMANSEVSGPGSQTPMELPVNGFWTDLEERRPYLQVNSYQSIGDSYQRLAAGPRSPSLPPRNVTFELLLTEGTQHRARLPLRVGIYPHDCTESIISTVKNFYGLYDGFGVSFENKHGDVLIPLYQNFEENMTVYVRVVEDIGSQDGTPRNSMSPRRARLGPPFEMGPPQNAGHSISRPSSRAQIKRSVSPQNSNGRRSQSTKARSRGSIKSRAGSTHGSTHGSIPEPFAEFMGDGSDSDGGNASVTSSRRDNIVASAEISVENIVEGGRRKRARFEASQLPLFVPNQIPVTTSVSSVSPQRRIDGQPSASPYQFSNQQTFTYNQPLPSPQSYSQPDFSYLGQGYGGYSGAANVHANRMRHRGSMSYVPPRYTGNVVNSAILPTPDPTINSVISDEDVALQLMRLGDASNFSSHARISTSTVDDTFSGRAELGSSAEASDEDSDMDDEDPHGGAVYSDDSEEDYDDRKDEIFKDSDGLMPEDASPPAKKAKLSKDYKMASKGMKIPKSRTSSASKPKVKTENGFKAPISPTSIPAQSRKSSTASLNMHHTQFAADEDDLSSKPRCQRCRKSKKGCDRQRPCSRCRDAGIGIEGCISEDEGNGRKGRFGRHMGVPIKKPAVTISSQEAVHMPAPGVMAAPGFIPDKNNRKLKR